MKEDDVADAAGEVRVVRVHWCRARLYRARDDLRDDQRLPDALSACERRLRRLLAGSQISRRQLESVVPLGREQTQLCSHALQSALLVRPVDADGDHRLGRARTLIVRSVFAAIGDDEA